MRWRCLTSPRQVCSASFLNAKLTSTNSPARPSARLAKILAQALQASKRDGSLLAGCCVYLDCFKLVNDQFGHAVADCVLVIGRPAFTAFCAALPIAPNFVAV